MMWLSAHAWGWCSATSNIPAMVLLWGAVLTAIVVTVRFASRQPSDSSAPTGTGFARAGHVAPSPGARGDVGEDDFYRRLM